MPGKFQTAFKGQTYFLATNILLSEELWILLADEEILTPSQVQSCKNRQRFTSDVEQVSEMLQILQKRDDDYFEPFCKVLQRLKQDDVVEKLRARIPVPPSASSSGSSSLTSGVQSAQSSTGRCNRCGVPEHDVDFPWKFKCFINAKRAGLLDNLNVSGNFYTYILQKNILSEVDVGKIKARGDEYSQKEELLSRLALCDDVKLDPFLQVLEYTNSQQVATVIRKHFA